MKYAYLIIAHNEWEVLQRLVSALDDERNEIFVHFDKKVKEVPVISCRTSTLHILDNRVDVRWGDYSLIECQFRLWEEAYKFGPFCSYVLISGVHFPLKNNDTICNYLKENEGMNIIQGIGKEHPRQEMVKVHHFNFFVKRYEYGSLRNRKIFQWLCTALNSVQRIMKIYRNKNISFWTGSNWTVLSHDGVKYLLDNHARVKRIFNMCFCGDEYIVPTMLLNSPTLSDTVLNTDILLRQDFIRANTRVFTEEDFSDLINSPCLFVRKVNKEHMALIDKLSLCLQGQK